MIRVVFAEDNYLVREGTAALLATCADIDLVAMAADRDELLAAVEEHTPDAVLTDIRMPPTNTNEGIEAAKRIRAEHPSVGVVVLSQFAEEEYAYALLKDGAAGLGYLLKERVADVDELIRALEEVSRGGSVLDPKVVEELVAAKDRMAHSPLARSPTASGRSSPTWPRGRTTPRSPSRSSSPNARWRSTSTPCSTNSISRKNPTCTDG